MPSGKTHDRLTTLASLAVFPVATIITTGSLNESFGTGLLNGAIASLTCAISGLLMSPDVDCMAHLKHRYGLFRGVWMPYYHACHWGQHYRVNGRITHRSFLSHSPIVGCLSKVLYLGAIAALALSFAGVSLEVITQVIQQHPLEVMVGAIALEVGAAAHYISDWVWSELR